jgi:hypothetical protein
MAPRHVQADSGRPAQLDPGVAGPRLDGTSNTTRWWDDKKADVISRLLERPRRWSALLRDWGNHIVGRVAKLGGLGLAMLYVMLMLSFSLVHAFPQKPPPKARQKRSR